MKVYNESSEPVNVELDPPELVELDALIQSRANQAICLSQEAEGARRQCRAWFLRPLGWDGRVVAG